MSKQTAVEWLVEQVFGKHTYVWNDVIEKAKAMEREQMGVILPSDEEIETFALSVSPQPQKNQSTWIAYKASIAGAKWIRDKIKGGEQ